MQGGLQRWLIESLIPDNIARQVLGYLTQFASKASGLGVAGLAVLLVTAIALILTIDKTLNNIWRVRTPRPLRAAGAGLLGRDHARAAGAGAEPDAPRPMCSRPRAGVVGERRAGQAAVRHLRVRAAGRRHGRALPLRAQHPGAAGRTPGPAALFVAGAIEIAKRLLAFYLGLVPTYSVLYGAFATVPILLVWIYVAWVIVLFGAVIAAYLPSLLSGVARRGGTPGWPFQLAIEVLQHLAAARGTRVQGPGRGRAGGAHAGRRAATRAGARDAGRARLGRPDRRGPGPARAALGAAGASPRPRRWSRCCAELLLPATEAFEPAVGSAAAGRSARTLSDLARPPPQILTRPSPGCRGTSPSRP